VGEADLEEPEVGPMCDDSESEEDEDRKDERFFRVSGFFCEIL
jgi:hypothetical protein